MEKKIFVKDLEVKESVNSAFLVKYIALMEAKDGKNYLNVILTDRTGDIEARKWNDAEDTLNTIKKGDFVVVDGKVNYYQNRFQIIIKSISKIDSEGMNELDFIASSKNPPDEMFDALIQIVDEVADVYIKDLLKMVLFDSEIQKRLKKWSAAKTVHHAYQGGLLEHVLSCARLAKTLATHYGANLNYVIAGAILHDLGKIYELTDGPMIEYTEEGKLVGHIVKSAELIDRFTYKIQNFPFQVKLHLKHIVLSHHGELAYGAVQLPMTSEAFLVHFIDLIDSKMNSVMQAKHSDQLNGHWTGYIKHLDRMIFKDELPSFLNHIEVLPEPEDVAQKTKLHKVPKHSDIPLKQNLAEQLKGFRPKE